MTTTRLEHGLEENVTASLSLSGRGHIPSAESDALIARLKEVMGNNVSSFSRQCHIRESLLRKYLTGSQPSAFNLVAIADAANVTVDWLATGRPPKTRAELRALVAQEATRKAAPAVPSSAPAINAGALQALIEGTLKAAPNAPVSAQAEHIAKVYKDLIDKGMITAEGLGAGHLDAVA